MLEAMLELQEETNLKINPYWHHTNYDWLRASWVEAAELMDHLCYKWWKKQELNLKQAHIELVDILHFILSDALVRNIDVDELENVTQTMEFTSTNGYTKEQKLEAVEYFVFDIMTGVKEKTFNDYYASFFDLCKKLDLDFKTLYLMYIGKNALNNFRQEHGYKEGTYTKYWPCRIPVVENNFVNVNELKTVEDNVYLEKFLAEPEATNNTYRYIYQRLTENYPYSFKANII